MKTCPSCGGVAEKVIYFGLPMYFHDDPHCATLWGFWSGIAIWFPVTSYNDWDEPCWTFMPYEGRYLPALWRWLTDWS